MKFMLKRYQCGGGAYRTYYSERVACRNAGDSVRLVLLLTRRWVLL